jgi:hypothetical protein
MNIKLLAVAACVTGATFAVGSSALGGTGRMHVACSADGNKIAAVFENGGISNSVDSGKTWWSGDAPTNGWWAVASSADGEKLVASGGGIYTSLDGGETWESNDVPVLGWTALGSSEDGTKLVAVGPGAVYTSTNSGSTWIPRNLPSLSWSSVSSSADGSKLAIAASSTEVGGGIYTSVDSGNTWISNSFPADTTTSFDPTIAASADGSRLAVAALDVGIYVSTNFGTNWSETSAEATWWEGVGLSADGGRITAITVIAFYLSTNLGATWTPVTSLEGGDYYQFASSADGDLLIGANWFDDSIDVFRLSPTPVLRIAPSSNSAVLSWILPSVSLFLQQSTDLNTTNWTDVGSPVTLTNLQYQTIVSMTTNQMFFRLAPQ